MKEIEKNLVAYNPIELQLDKRPDVTLQEFVTRSGKQVEIYRRENGILCTYKIVVANNELRAESEEQKRSGGGPHKIVALNCGPFFISRDDLATLEAIHQTFSNTRELAAAREPIIGWNTPIRSHHTWTNPDLAFYCGQLVSQLTTIAVAPDRDRQTRFRRLSASAQSGSLSMRGNTSLPYGIAYYHSFLDELRLRAQEIFRLHSRFRIIDNKLSPTTPDGRIIDSCRRSIKLVLASGGISSSTELKKYKPFTTIHSTLYHAVRLKRKWLYDEETEKNWIRFLAGKTYEIHASEQIYRNTRAEWSITVSAVCAQT
ncbi:MAG: hypothetical protein A2V81_04305 [Candidatus Abawacabacteria bacterium RBG_16_42_10]|uniref:Uncharacterized protein n=1 Tax=Candidatus Abawacabacteria bacterium RBG_16_42_10 TaxID=1817814 RepID=A0A1F4XJT9_9BACT|nr:MAG: hypothetical protein A2V81_04305 [Candidatus Abawacabacteria bacterium RBG_16_42_10]